MGFKLLSRVYSEIKNTTPTEQAILAYLAFRANDTTEKCFPSRKLIEAATHFKQSGISNGLNGLHEKKILRWTKGGRKSKDRGYSVANEYLFSFPKLSTEQASDEPLAGIICHEAACADATTRHVQMPRGGNTICHDVATNIIGHNQNHSSVIKMGEPMEEVLRHQISEIGRAWASRRSNQPQPQREPSLIQRAMDLCGVSDMDNRRVFSSIMMKKGRARCEDELYAFESELRQHEHRNVRNLAALLTSRLQQLPNYSY